MLSAQATLIDSLRQRFGDKSVITDADSIAPWLSDWRGRYVGSAPAMLMPGVPGWWGRTSPMRSPSSSTSWCGTQAAPSHTVASTTAGGRTPAPAR